MARRRSSAASASSASVSVRRSASRAGSLRPRPASTLPERAPRASVATIEVHGPPERRDRLLERPPLGPQLAERQKGLRGRGRAVGDRQQQRLCAGRIAAVGLCPRARDLVGESPPAPRRSARRASRRCDRGSHQAVSGAQTFWRMSAIRSSIARSSESAASIPAARAASAVFESARGARRARDRAPRRSRGPACRPPARRTPGGARRTRRRSRPGFGPTSAATRSTASGPWALASTFTSAAIFPRSTKARSGAAQREHPAHQPVDEQEHRGAERAGARRSRRRSGGCRP